MRAMDTLEHDPASEVLLVSLKAGGVRLNLVSPSRVYPMGPYWNPARPSTAWYVARFAESMRPPAHSSVAPNTGSGRPGSFSRTSS
jgi:hypothetical protein